MAAGLQREAETSRASGGENNEMHNNTDKVENVNVHGAATTDE